MKKHPTGGEIGNDSADNCGDFLAEGKSMLSVDDEVSMLEIEQVAPTNFEDLVAEEVAEEFEVLFRLSVPPNEVSMMVKATKSVYDMALKALVEMGHASDHDSAINVCFAGAPVGERTFEELGVDECGVVTIMWLRLTWTKAASIAEVREAQPH